MRALLLCAGLGTRLKPLTDSLPKCLMPILGRPLLEYWLKLLVAGGIKEILINTHHHADLVSRFIENSEFKSYVKLVYEPDLLLTGGTLLANRDFFERDSILLAHADNLTSFDIRAFLKCHQDRPKNAEFTMMMFQTKIPETCGILELDPQGIVQAFHEKVKNPPGNLANAAVYILEPTIFHFLEELGKPKIDFSTEIIPQFMGRIHTFLNNVYHRDIGTLQSFLQAQIEYPLTLEALSATSGWSQIAREQGSKICEDLEKVLS